MKVFFIFIVFTALFFMLERIFQLDLIISDKIFSWNSFNDNYLLNFLAKLAPVPTILAAVYCLKKSNISNKFLLFEVILLISFAPLLIHCIIKPAFNRPRPSEISQYKEDSKLEYTKAFEPGEEGDSFPSGHSAAAFSLLFLYFTQVFKEYEKRILLIIPGLLWGFAIGTIRILQGRHFITDVVASLTVTFICCFIITHFTNQLYSKNEYSHTN